MSTIGTVANLARESGKILAPLASHFEGEGVPDLLGELGLRPPPGLLDAGELVAALSSGASSAARLSSLVAGLTAAIRAEDAAQIGVSGARLLDAINEVVAAIRAAGRSLDDLASTLDGLTPSQQAQLRAFAASFPRRLFDRLVVEYLEARLPGLATALLLVGAIEIVAHPPGPEDGLDAAHTRKTLDFSRIVKLLTDPAGLLRDVYRWGEPDFDGLALFQTVKMVLDRMFERPAEILLAPGMPPSLEALGFRLEVDKEVTPPGLGASLRFQAEVEVTESLTAGDWEMLLHMLVRLAADLEFLVTPLLAVDLRTPGASAEVVVSAGAQRAENSAPILLCGRSAGSRLEARSLGGEVSLEARWLPGAGRMAVEPQLHGHLRAGKLVLSGDGDSLISRLLSRFDVSARFDVGVTWSPARGLRFDSSTGTAVDVPVHAGIGGLRVESLHVELGFVSPTLHLDLAATMKMQLGPLTATMERLGLRGKLGRPDAGGNLGPFQLDFDLAPPTGFGLTMDTALATLDGFLAYQPEQQLYGGAVALRLAGTLDLAALGVITLDDSSGTGWSLAAIAGARFPGIQLGWGFTLDGAGGLVALHRRFAVEEVRADLRRGAASLLLDMRPAGSDLRTRIAALDSLCPRAHGRHVVGPSFSLGWGTPKLLQADLALLVELPAPVRIILLGAVQVGLPTLEQRIVDLRMDVLGVVDLGRKTLAIDASLHDSKLAGYELSGDMALRMGWGDEPQFLLAIGGFHPRFHPPAGFPSLRRVALTIGDNPRLRLESYLALTTNTVQIGAHVDLYYKIAGLRIAGYLHFDTLLELRPFQLEAEIRAGVSISYKGINFASADLGLLLTGPRPWHGKGKATIGILWWDVSVGFDVTWGSDEQPALPPAPDVGALLREALAAPGAWQSELPAGERGWLVLRDQAGDSAIRVHPLSAIVIRQKVVPLDYPITRFGSAPLGSTLRFKFTSVTVDGTEVSTRVPVSDHFAPGQFTGLRKDEALDAPSFETMPSGVRFGDDTVSLSTTARVAMEHESVVQDPLAPPHPPARSTVSAALVQAATAHHSATSPGRPRPGRVGLRPPGYVLASTRDLAITAEGAALAGGRTSYAALREALREARRAAGHAPALQIVPRAETPNGSARVVVVREDDHLRNIDFVDTMTGRQMTREEFVAAIHDGEYPDYAVRMIHGLPTPVSLPNESIADNLG